MLFCNCSTGINELRNKKARASPIKQQSRKHHQPTSPIGFARFNNPLGLRFNNNNNNGNGLNGNCGVNVRNISDKSRYPNHPRTTGLMNVAQQQKTRQVRPPSSVNGNSGIVGKLMPQRNCPLAERTAVLNRNAVNVKLAIGNNRRDDNNNNNNKNYCELAVDLSKHLRLRSPTTTDDDDRRRHHEISKVDLDAEDINGPYNFRKLLRPAEYLPTESLRKRKCGQLLRNNNNNNNNLLPLPIKDKIVELKNNVKRRAPLAPNQKKPL